ncbi:aspartyl/glutamyl-tRNA(Asn/Gln) amidotransferase subunit A [Seinonella peptonophila]|uniref:Glutamyl-tRNA(Gln) amidotransferase subunit A n=1 Tax=Seinonella peptonophila TaxID=112248 RepID=A0A1M4Z2Q8_9BACL|nr:Asp-tRNA(Asn)/Glu-tRNA(Gln) amidotransferase subunit GatA [Seinonella peptonophila]SHF12300.1 aspartyl/glutamyl-tRNA(Asn/Gln) amidotransferase subunit A [Seinonella peptonophila]
MSLLSKSVHEIHNGLKKGEFSARELTQASIDRIQAVDQEVQAFLHLDEEGAVQRAEEIDKQIAAGKQLSMLTAIPMGIKDNICTKDLFTTCGSQILANYKAIYNATVIEKLDKVGANLIGKTNMDEFAMGSSTENSSFFPTKNPWDLKRVPGGSSGGSAAAVAAGEVCFALGSDTGGSIRQPASFCGVVGLKPTYGRVSRFGLVAFASSLDQIGPLTNTVDDAAVILEAIQGYDDRDNTSATIAPTSYRDSLTGDIKGLRVGVPKEMMGSGIDETVREQIKGALTQLEKMGAVIDEVSLPHSQYAVATYYLIAPAEASSNLARFDGVRYGVRREGIDLIDLYHETRSQGFGDEVKRRVMLGTYALSSGYYDAYYRKAQQARTLISQDFEAIFADYDVVIGPTAPTTAFALGEQIDDPLTMYINDVCTIPVNLAGLPAISLPCGMANGLPVGLQIIGKAFDEATILRVAHAYEQESASIGKPVIGGVSA